MNNQSFHSVHRLAALSCTFAAFAATAAGDYVTLPPTVLPGFTTSAAVAAGPGGQFLVLRQPGIENDVLVQRYDAGSTPLGAPTLITAAGAAIVQNARLATAADGSFVVVRTISDSPSPTNPVLPANQQTIRIVVNRFAADGAARGAEIVVDQFQANTRLANDVEADIASDAQGNFALAWRRSTTPLPNVVNDRLLARRYTADGLPSGNEVSFDSVTAFLSLALAVVPTLSAPAVTTDVSGAMTVAWAFRPAGEITPQNVFVRTYGPRGFATTLQQRVNTGPLSDAISVASVDIASDSSGRKTVIWDGCGGVCARRLTASGLPTGVQNQVSAGLDALIGPTLGFRMYPQLATTAAGEVLAVWAPLGTTEPRFTRNYLRSVGGADEATSTGPLIRVSGVDPAGDRPQIAVDDLGRVTVLFQRQQGPFELRVQRFFPGN